MSRKGRPRKSCPREPNGRPQRPTLAQIDAADRAQRQAEIAIVMAQPHRVSSPDPRSQWNGSAIGRFLLMKKAGDVDTRGLLFQAAERYMRDYRAWWGARGVPRPVRDGEGKTPPELGPDEQADEDERVRALGAKLGRINLSIGVLTHAGYVAMRDAILHEVDVPWMLDYDVMVALGQLAVEYGLPMPRPVQ